MLPWVLDSDTSSVYGSLNLRLPVTLCLYSNTVSAGEIKYKL